jgi:hypothetical protein
MHTAFWIGAVAVFAVIAIAWSVIWVTEFRTLLQAAPPAVQQLPDRNAWIDARLATETHPGRRMALRMMRDHGDLEEQ